MVISAVINRVDFDRALNAAADLGTDEELPGLSAKWDEALWGRFSTAWDAVEHALRQAFQFGVDAARVSVNGAIAAAEEVLGEAGKLVTYVHAAFLARLQQYLTCLIDSALARVATQVTVGARTFDLDQIELSNKVSLTGSLSLNITEVAALTGAGEVTVVARYALAP